MVGMPPTLSSSILPRPGNSGDPLDAAIWTTEPIPESTRIRIGDDQRGERATVLRCGGSGPYTLLLAAPFTGTYMAGTPLTVVDCEHLLHAWPITGPWEDWQCGWCGQQWRIDGWPSAGLSGVA